MRAKIYCTINKAVTDDEGALTIEGYASSEQIDRHGDMILKDAFTKALPAYMANPVLLFMHKMEDVIGTVTDAVIDDNGLWIKAIVPKSAGAVYEKIKDKLYRTLSVGIDVTEAEPNEKGFTIKDLSLYEISVVSIPANTDALFNVKNKFMSDNKEKTMFEKIEGLIKSLTKKNLDVTLADGTTVVVVTEDSVPKVGDAVTVEGAPAPDGEHALPDGTIITTEAGVITAIVEPVVEEVEAANEEVEALKAKTEALGNQVAELGKDIEALKSLAETNNKKFEAIIESLTFIGNSVKSNYKPEGRQFLATKVETKSDLKEKFIASQKNKS